MFMSIPAQSSFEHSEGSRRTPRHSGTQRVLGNSEGTKRVLGNSEGTQTLGNSEGTQRALGHLRHSGTRPLRALEHQGTWILRAPSYLDTQALRHSCTRDTLFSRLIRAKQGQQMNISQHHYIPPWKSTSPQDIKWRVDTVNPECVVLSVPIKRYFDLCSIL